MGKLGRGVSVAVQILGVVAGVLLTLLVAFVSVTYQFVMECTTDPDNAAAVLVVRVALGLLTAAVILLPFVLLVVRRRLTGWSRALAAVAYPVLVVMTFVGVTAGMAAVLHFIDGSDATSNCM